MARKKTAATVSGIGRAPSQRSNAIQHALESLRDRSGRLTAERVVQAAKNPKHPLHREFGWDDEEQAHLHRLDRARELISRYITVTIIHRSEKIVAPYYVRDPAAAPAAQGYVALVGATLSRANAIQIMSSELDRCESSIVRARRITHVLDARFPGLSDQLENLLEKIVLLRETVSKAAA